MEVSCAAGGVTHTLTKRTLLDISTSSILFQISDNIQYWSDDELYKMLGEPETEAMERFDEQSVLPHAPDSVVAPITVKSFLSSGLILESIVLANFGQSFIVSSKPTDYRPATVINFRAPETRFESRVEFATDV
jgi:serine/threonine-protein kinase SRPK3